MVAVIVEWTGSRVLGIVGTKGLPQESGEILASLVVGQSIVGALDRSTTDGKQNLLSLLLAVLDIGRNDGALVEERRRHIGLAVDIVAGIAVVAKVSTGVAKAGLVVLGGVVDEADGDIVEVVLVAVVPEPSISLLSPVNVDLGLRDSGSRLSGSSQDGRCHNGFVHDDIK